MREIIVQKSETVAVDYQAVFDSILMLNVRESMVTVCLASFVSGEAIPRFERLQVTDEVEREFRGIIEKLIKKYQKDRYTNGLLFPDYAPTSKPPEYEIEHFDLTKYEAILEQVRPLNALTEIDVFEEDKQFISTLRFYVLVVQTLDGDPVYCFRFHTLKKTLAQSRFLAICKQQGSYYHRVEEPIFLFDQEIDCLCRSGVMFIFNKSNFQQIFHFLDELQNVAKETLAHVKLHVPIKNFDDLLRACQGNLHMLRKLKNIAAQPYLDKITMGHVKIVIAAHGLPIQIEEVEGQEMIVYEEEKPWVILKLLDDDYLRSLLTEQSYEVDGKRKLAK